MVDYRFPLFVALVLFSYVLIKITRTYMKELVVPVIISLSLIWLLPFIFIALK
ncbi:hypothetical protein D3C72_929690 [compost metagenome]